MTNVEKIEGSPSTKQIIKLKSVFGKAVYASKRTLHLPPSINEYGKWHSEWVRRVDHHGDLILGKDDDPNDFYIKEDDVFKVDHDTTYDLSIKEHKRIWDAIKNHEVIANSFEEGQNSGTAYLYVHEEIVEARKTVKKHYSKYQAMKLVMEDNKTNIYQIAKLLDSPMDDSSYEEVQAFLLSVATTTPSKIINTYNDDSIATKIFLNDAVSKQVILLQGGVYMFMVDNKPVILGMNENSVINWLQNPVNKPIVTEIGIQCNPPKKVVKRTTKK